MSQDVTQMSKSEFARFFKENLERLTGLCFEDCQEVSGGMAVFGDEGTIKALWANPKWSLHIRDLDYDPDYGWNVIVSSGTVASSPYPLTEDWLETMSNPERHTSILAKLALTELPAGVDPGNPKVKQILERIHQANQA